MKINKKYLLEIERINEKSNKQKAVDAIFTSKEKDLQVSKSFTIRGSQIAKLSEYSKLANKSDSELLRDILDYFFETIES